MVGTIYNAFFIGVSWFDVFPLVPVSTIQVLGLSTKVVFGVVPK